MSVGFWLSCSKNFDIEREKRFYKTFKDNSVHRELKNGRRKINRNITN